MESYPDPAAALRDAETTRSTLALAAAPSRSFFTSLAFAIAAQIALTAIGFGAGQPALPVLGVVLFAVVGGVQLLRLRRASGIWVAGFASRVVLGTDARASVYYVVALSAAIWAAFASRWGLVALCSAGGGLAYALTGRRWVHRYQAQPQDHAGAESPLELLALCLVAVAALVLLVLER